MFLPIFIFILLTISLLIYLKYRNNKKLSSILKNYYPQDINWKPKPRKTIINDLSTVKYDLVIIGGGVTGAGCALDASTRGLSVALIEKGDFGQETSSKTTKLIYGGIKFFYQSILNLREYYTLFLSLKERDTILANSVYLAKPLKMVIPVYRWYQLIFYYLKFKIYQFLSFNRPLGGSSYISKNKLKNIFPMINPDGLKGGITFYESTQNDMRNNLMLVLTAHYYGASTINYVEALDFIKEDNKIVGVKCKDLISKKEFEIFGKGVINTTGPFTDKLKTKSSDKKEVMKFSKGLHLVLPKKYGPRNMGLVDLDVLKEDVLFSIPFKDRTIIGSTEYKLDLKNKAGPTKKDVNIFINTFKKVLKSNKYIKDDLYCVYSGIRSLIKSDTCDKNMFGEKSFTIIVSSDKLITVTGGTWTIYRKMAEEAIDKAVNVFKLHTNNNCITNYIKVLGSEGFNQSITKKLAEKLKISDKLSKHLCENYGTLAYKFINYKNFNYISEPFLFTEGEVMYLLDNEMVRRTHDILARRTSIAFLDVKEANAISTKINEYLKEYFNWSEKEVSEDRKDTLNYLKSLGLEIVD